MPVSFVLESDLLHLNAAGQYEPEDIPRQFVAGITHPACPLRVALLLDVSDSEVLEARSSAQIRDIAEFLRPFGERIGHRCAVVASRDVHFGLARMGSAYCAGIGIEANVFRSREEALGWLRDGAMSDEPPGMN